MNWAPPSFAKPSNKSITGFSPEALQWSYGGNRTMLTFPVRAVFRRRADGTRAVSGYVYLADHPASALLEMLKIFFFKKKKKK